MRKILALSIAVTSLLVLSACTPATTTPSPSATAAASPSATASSSASPSPSPSASPSPTVAAASDCTEDQIMPGRLGCLDVNLPAAGNPGEGDIIWMPDHCSVGDGRYIYAGSDLIAVEGRPGTVIGRIDVYDTTFTTPTGIHVGSTEAEVLAAYPGMALTTSFSGTKLLVITEAAGSYVIELANGWGGEPEWTVANIRIYAAGTDANYPVYGTEDFAGACPADF